MQYKEGWDVGCWDGMLVGWDVGEVGFDDGWLDGWLDGWDDGCDNGWLEGWDDGCDNGWLDGWLDGLDDGWREGDDEGCLEGFDDGNDEGCLEGFDDGTEEGDAVGDGVGQAWLAPDGNAEVDIVLVILVSQLTHITCVLKKAFASIVVTPTPRVNDDNNLQLANWEAAMVLL